MANQTDFFAVESVVRGHHIYKRTWTPVLGETLQIEMEEKNDYDPKAVAITKDGTTCKMCKSTFSMKGCGHCTIVLYLTFIDYVFFDCEVYKTSQFANKRYSQSKHSLR